MGVPEFAVPALDSLVKGGYGVAAVYVTPDKPAGRGREVSFSPVKRLAVDLGLEVRQVATFRDEEAVAALREVAPDMIVVAAFGLILPPSVLHIPLYGCLNLHPSLLPRYRGPTPIPAAILDGVEETGSSIMLMNEGVDCGPVLAQRTLRVAPDDTTKSLTEKLSLASAALLMETLPRWLERSIEPRPQRDEDATYTKMIDKSDGEIDWRMSAVELWRRVRAYYPWPVCCTRWRGRRIRIIESIPSSGDGRPGLVVELEDGGVGVCTGDGVLGLLRLQLEGKREMTAADFIRGQRDFIGSLLPD